MSTPTCIPDPGSERVSWGEWEPDPDVPAVYAGQIEPLAGIFGGPLVLRPQVGGYRRARNTSWTEGGQLVGRRDWERRRV